MKEVPVLEENMAPWVLSIGEGQGYRPCLRNRDPNDQAFASEAPLSKKKCPQDRGFCKRTATGREAEIMGEQAVEFESFGPRTPTKDEASDRNSEGSWEVLELCLLERISQSLSVPDLCRLSQVSKHYHHMCARDALWEWRTEERGFAKADSHENLVWNYRAASTGILHAAPLASVSHLHFSGDVAIVDPFELFFAGKCNNNRQVELRQIVKEFKHTDLVLTYRGIQSAVLRTSCVVDDDDTAFEVFRDGKEVGANVTRSGVVAVVPKRLVLKLVEENGGMPEDHGVIVVGVDGVLMTSLDGDFIIRHPEPARGKPVEVPFSGETDYADVVCSTGGSWTEESDSDDDGEELTEEEMAEAMAEAAFVSDSYFQDRSGGLIHNFTDLEVAMLS